MLTSKRFELTHSTFSPEVVAKAGTLIQVIAPVEDGHFLLIGMDDRQFHIFASNLADRGRPVVANETVRGF